MMGRFLNLIRTTSVRLTALYILLFSLVAVGLALYMTKLSISMLANQTQMAVQEEVESIRIAYERGGVRLLVRTIDRRSRQPGAFLYLVTDITGQILAGNVRSIQPGLLTGEGFEGEAVLYSRFTDQERRGDHKAMAMLIVLPNGMKLMVGRDMGDPERFVEIIRKALLFAFSAMALGAFLIWFFIGRRALQRIDNISKASQRLMDGDLTGRLPVTGSGDEFDRLSKNLNIMLERIEELNTGLRHVSDNIAHDLKTPLTRLHNRAEAALVGKKSEEEYREALESVITESEQLIRTFGAILMISRIEAGNILANMDDVNLRLIVEDVAELYEPVAEEANVALILGSTFDADLQLSRELVAQTLFNLVDNAIKYAGGEERKAEITLSMERRDGEVAIVVADNGPGIPTDEYDRVTERFYRLEKSRTLPGSGIGLSLAKAVMQLHGGKLIFEDANPGLKVVIIFPETSTSPKQNTAPVIRAHAEKCEAVFGENVRKTK